MKFKHELTKAERLLFNCGITEPEQIDIEAISVLNGATVQYGEITSCEAYIIGTQKKAIIQVSELIKGPRRNFSIAHELGHWFYHRGQTLFCRKQDIGDRIGQSKEKLANKFASELILPRYLFEPIIAKLGRPSVSELGQIAHRFKVSREAVLRRFVDTTALPCALVFYSAFKRDQFLKSSHWPSSLWPKEDVPTLRTIRCILDRESEDQRSAIRGNYQDFFDGNDHGAAKFNYQAFRAGVASRRRCGVLIYCI